MTALDGEAWQALGGLHEELVHGAPGDFGYVLNPQDPGLLRSLRKLSAEEASAVGAGGGATIAAHVDHLRYSHQLLNRWSQGENPFAEADYAASWKISKVNKTEWRELLETLEEELVRWNETLHQPRDLTPVELRGVVSSVVHLAYHLGAIRQIDRGAAGPPATDSQA
jgi:hypothetical protein